MNRRLVAGPRFAKPRLPKAWSERGSANQVLRTARSSSGEMLSWSRHLATCDPSHPLAFGVPILGCVSPHP